MLKNNNFSNKNLTSLPKEAKLVLSKNKKIEDQKKYNMLSPTLGDFLTDIKKNKQQIQNDLKTAILKKTLI